MPHVIVTRCRADHWTYIVHVESFHFHVVQVACEACSVVPGERLASASRTLDADVLHVRASCFNRPRSCFCNIWHLQDHVHAFLVYENGAKLQKLGAD